jgi:hypothetical protein
VEIDNNDPGIITTGCLDWDASNKNLDMFTDVGETTFHEYTNGLKKLPDKTTSQTA